jgi:hypothetical protein
MVVKVAGLWELGWSAPVTEIDLWQYPLRDFGVDEFIMSPVSGIQGEVTEYPQISDAFHANPELTVVFVEEHGSTQLTQFVHPDDALYVFGKANYSPFAAHMREGDESVRIDTKLTAGLMWPHQAACVVLHDRGVKRAWQ